MNEITVSIIIRTLNEEMRLVATLDMLYAQSVQCFEIIFLDSGSTDSTVDIIKRAQINHQNIKFRDISDIPFSFGRSLNIGCEMATGDFISFLSAHCPPVSNVWLENYLVLMRTDSQIAGVYGKQVPFADAHPILILDEYQIFDDLPREQNFPDVSFSNANSFIRRSAWLTVPFNEDVTGGEDMLWAKSLLELRWRIIYTPQSVVYHSHNETLEQIRNRAYINYLTFYRYIKPNKTWISLFMSTGVRILKDVYQLCCRKQYRFIPLSFVVRLNQLIGRLKVYGK